MHGHHDRIVDNHYIVLKEENMSVSVIFKIAAVGILVTLNGNMQVFTLTKESQEHPQRKGMSSID